MSFHMPHSDDTQSLREHANSWLRIQHHCISVSLPDSIQISTKNTKCVRSTFHNVIIDTGCS